MVWGRLSSVGSLLRRGVSVTRTSPLSTSSLVRSARWVLARRPLVTNCVTYGLLYSGSEWLQQTILRHTEPGAGHQHDLATIARWVAGTNHHWA